MDREEVEKFISSRYFSHGLWAVDEINTKVYSKSHVQFSYEKYEVNAIRHIVNVCLNPIDKIKGVTIEEKARKRLNELKVKLNKANEYELELRRIKNRIVN